MGCGGHREGQADASSSWISLCIERIHPQTLANRGTLTLESLLGRHRLEQEGQGELPVPSCPLCRTP